MATAKKSPVKKTVSKAKVAPKKPVSKKKTVVSKKVTLKSFKLAPDTPFFTVKITKQTIYWSILLIVILVTQLWILNVQLDVIQSLDTLSAGK